MGALSVRARDSVNNTQRVLALAIAKMDASLNNMRYPSWPLGLWKPSRCIHTKSDKGEYQVISRRAEDVVGLRYEHLSQRGVLTWSKLSRPLLSKVQEGGTVGRYLYLLPKRTGIQKGRRHLPTPRVSLDNDID